MNCLKNLLAPTGRNNGHALPVDMSHNNVTPPHLIQKAGLVVADLREKWEGLYLWVTTYAIDVSSEV